MKRYIPTLIFLGALAACSHEDIEKTKQNAKEAEQEIKKEVDQAGKLIKKGAEQASHEIKKELGDGKRKDTKETTR